MAPRLAVLYHPACLDHVAGPNHPERPERLHAVMAALEKGGVLGRAARPEPREARTSEITLCHSAHHLDRVQSACTLGRNLDPDTGTSPESWEAALLAAGAGLTAADMIMKGEASRAFCAVRPPGHHAESDRAMGFCLFNNAAIAARHLQKAHGLKRVAIVDFDAHHGNGTQEIFYEDGSVLYCSTHLWPFYPGSGSEDEVGRGEGEGTTVNCPMPAGAGLREFKAAFSGVIIPALDRFGPEALVVSAGFDSHEDDPLTDLGLRSEDFGTLTSLLVEAADRLCGGKVISFLEGGYNLDALASGALAHVKALLPR